mmetsp:Transcript_43675/g.114774  ORF Transcript_43675/g.114774 Transcript_43675/m.114774 type:complete len:228 (-) Transcript_43675:482-1165(-)
MPLTREVVISHADHTHAAELTGETHRRDGSKAEADEEDGERAEPLSAGVATACACSHECRLRAHCCATIERRLHHLPLCVHRAEARATFPMTGPGRTAASHRLPIDARAQEFTKMVRPVPVQQPCCRQGATHNHLSLAAAGAAREHDVRRRRMVQLEGRGASRDGSRGELEQRTRKVREEGAMRHHDHQPLATLTQRLPMQCCSDASRALLRRVLALFHHFGVLGNQ